jgi:hypothetical protein
MLVQLADKTLSAGEGTAGEALGRVVGRDSERFGLFASENSAVTMCSLDRRAVDDEHE